MAGMQNEAKEKLMKDEQNRIAADENLAQCLEREKIISEEHQKLKVKSINPTCLLFMCRLRGTRIAFYFYVKTYFMIRFIADGDGKYETK